jgi:hypothetical protein
MSQKLNTYCPDAIFDVISFRQSRPKGHIKSLRSDLKCPLVKNNDDAHRIPIPYYVRYYGGSSHSRSP